MDTLNKKRHWLDIAEYASLVGLGVGSVASFATSQVVYASAPISLLVLLNLANRNRFEQETQSNLAIAVNDIDQRLAQHVELLNQQILSLPTPEMMGSLKKSMLTRNRELSETLSAEMKQIQQDLQNRLDSLQQRDIEGIRGEVRQLRDYYNQLCDSMVQMTTRLHQVSPSARVDELDSAIAQLRSEAAHLQTSLQILSDQTKPTIHSLQEQVNRLHSQFHKLPTPFDASALRQEVTELIRVVADLVPRREWTTLVTEMQALYYQQAAQSEAEEGLRRKLQDLTQQLQNRPTRDSLTSLQQQIGHLNRQVQKLPSPFDPTSLKQELAKLLTVVTQMVPRRDFSGLVTQVNTLQQQQEFQEKLEETLHLELDSLNQQLQSLIAEPADHPESAQHPEPAQHPKSAQYGEQTATATGSLPTAASLNPATSSPPKEFESRLEEMLQRELGRIDRQLLVLPTSTEFQHQVETTLRQAIQDLNQQMGSFVTGPHYEFVLDFKSALPAEGDTRSAQASQRLLAEHPSLRVPDSRQVLEDALETSEHRLIIILPWSSRCSLNDELMQRLERFFQHNRHLDLGWCYLADRETPRFLSAINQRWQVHPLKMGKLQDTLQKLLQIKRRYPAQFQFKILGTRENFLVSDDRYAVLGIDDALSATTLVPNLELKLRTDDPAIIQQLTQRFDQPTLNLQDVAAYWNRAATRYDLGDKQGALDDFDHILQASPDDALAYNFRGLVRYDLGDGAGAIADFGQALQLQPQQAAAYCNRAYIRTELGDPLGAIADYTAALQIQPDCAIAFFFRGMACQKVGDLRRAIADYSEAIQLAPPAPTPYYYRGLARPRVGDIAGAIADLETALELFTAQDHEANARKVFNSLQKLRKSVNGSASAVMPAPQSVGLGDVEPAKPNGTAAAAEGAVELQSAPTWPAADQELPFENPFTTDFLEAYGIREFVDAASLGESSRSDASSESVSSESVRIEQSVASSQAVPSQAASSQADPSGLDPSDHSPLHTQVASPAAQTANYTLQTTSSGWFSLQFEQPDFAT